MDEPRLPKGPVTADDLARIKNDMLENDPAYRAAMEAKAAERDARRESLRQAEAPIVGELRASGVLVDSVWDLVNTSVPYPDALPILLAHLELGGYPERVMVSLGRALAVKPTIRYWDRIQTRYLNARCPGEEDGAAVALAACATKNEVADLIDLLDVEERGESRVYFLRPINRLGGAPGKDLIESLREHPILGREATAVRRRQRRNQG